MNNMRKRVIIWVLTMGLLIFSGAHAQAVDLSEYKDSDGYYNTEFFMKLLPLHKVKGLPGPYDWMATNPEPGQTFAEFKKSQPVRPDEQKRFIYIMMLGNFDETRQKIIQQASEFIEVYYGLPIKFLDPMTLDKIPAKARRVHPQTQDKQILSTYVIEEVLVPRKPDDAFCVIAFSSADLWPGAGWNFVFGQASMDDRVGVWSIYRNGDPNESPEAYQLALWRTIKVGTHEIGHMFSLPHCIYYESNMNGSNHIQESDKQPLALCPIDLRKLHYSTGMDVVKRYQDLIAICDKLKLHKEKAFYEKSLQALLSLE